MRRSLRLTVTLWGAALLLSVIALITLAAVLAHGGAPALAASAASGLAPLDGTPTITPIGTLTPAAVPTISAGTAGSVTPAAPPLTGATIATSLTCITTLIGLIIAVVTLNGLLRGGYGPFLRALIFGGKRGAVSDLNSNDGQWDASHTLNYRPGPEPLDDPLERRGGSRSRGERRERASAGERGGSNRRGPSRSRRNGWD